MSSKDIFFLFCIICAAGMQYEEIIRNAVRYGQYENKKGVIWVPVAVVSVMALSGGLKKYALLLYGIGAVLTLFYAYRKQKNSEKNAGARILRELAVVLLIVTALLRSFCTPLCCARFAHVNSNVFYEFSPKNLDKRKNSTL